MSADSRIVRSLFKGGAIVFTGLIISKLFGLIYRIIVGRSLGPEEYGIISVMLAVSSVIGALAYIGIPQGVQKYVSEYRGDDNTQKQVEIVRTGLLLVTIPSFLTGLALFLLAPWLSAELFNEPRAIWPLRFIAIILPLRAWRKVLVKTTEAHEKMQYRVYINYIYRDTTKLILTLLFIFLGYSYLGAAAAFAIAFGSAVIVAIYFTYKVLPELFKTPRKPSKQYNKLLHHSWPLFAAGLFASIAGYIDTFMLQTFLGSEEVGLYNAAYPFAAAITFAGSAFGSIYLSNASKLYGAGKTKEMNEAYKLVVKWVSLISLPSFVILITYPETILQLFGSEYLEMANILRILAFGFLLSALIGPATKIIQAIDKTKYKLYLTLFIGTANIVLNYLLIPIYGVLGAALATTLTFAFAFMLKIILIKYLVNTIPFKTSAIKIILSATLPGIALLYLTNKLIGALSLWLLPPIIMLYGLLYGLMILMTRTIGEEDVVIMKYIRDKIGLESEILENIIRRCS